MLEIVGGIALLMVSFTILVLGICLGGCIISGDITTWIRAWRRKE